jgi:hypothetical protein
VKAPDKPAFVRLLTDALAFYRQDVSTFAIGVWWAACEGFELEQVTKALTAHALDPERGQFAPKPADLVRILHGTLADRSLIAWGKVLDAIRRVGAYMSVVFDDGAIHAAVDDMGGWPKVCRSSMDELPFLQKRFCELHRVYSQRPDHPYPARLVGQCESMNRHAGQPVAPPMLVGDPRRAAQVQQLGVTGSKTLITAADAVPEIPRIGRAA